MFLLWVLSPCRRGSWSRPLFLLAWHLPLLFSGPVLRCSVLSQSKRHEISSCESHPYIFKLNKLHVWKLPLWFAYLNSGLLGHAFELGATGTCIWIPGYCVMYLNSGLLSLVSEFRTSGSCIWIPDYWVMYLNSGLLGLVFEFRTSGSCIWIPD